MDFIPLLLFWVLFDIPYLLYRRSLLLIRTKKSKHLKYYLVSIIIPAYNEEVCIKKTLLSCIKQSYKKLEIIVINDGSTDNTVKVVEKFQEDYKKLLKKRKIFLKLFTQKNKGKAKALNTGKKHAKGKILITIDADSFLNQNAIKTILPYFSSLKIGAVAGNIIAVSRGKLIGYLQKLEYELGVHFIRKSQSSLGNVLVTPGAFSAYRKTAVKKFEEGTLTEDFDSSLRILERGNKIVLAPDAICYTQVPLSISDIIRQRVRWQQGGLEVFAKHIFHKKRPFLMLEYLFLFFFAFYGLFPRLLAFLLIPLLIFQGSYTIVLTTIIIFIIYSLLIYSLQFSVVIPHDRKAILMVPLFIVYYYTIVLYSVLIAQIRILKRRTSWEKLQRYHT